MGRAELLRQPRLLELTGAGEEDLTQLAWETLQKDEQVHIQRHRDRSLFCGSVFVKLTGHVPNTTVAHVAHCFSNFADRGLWDKQMDSFRVMYNVQSNDIVYGLLHVPPLTDRDFFLYHATLCHESGRGIMFYTRSASNSLCPPTRAVRATQYMASHCLMQDPDGKGVTFTSTQAVEPHIPFLPRWVMTLLLPAEFRRWRSAVDQRSHELHRDGVPIPVASVLQTEAQLRAPAKVEEASPSGYTTEDGYPSDASDAKTGIDGADSPPGTHPDASPCIEDAVATVPVTSPGLCWCC
ncbi:unnamed protein product [Symbiodinium natans]|uniref:START domain-containing protein n=1 Tax=Symbiodinium natans TaxID=878477 RepID=A0A812HSB8_9DINO|nr:unnamed protein product [Symbiodinium natans]